MNFTDPNLIYLLLLVGLWSSVFSLYVPGTGIPELVALVTMVGAILALAANPATSWLAVLLIGAGVLSYLLVPLYRRALAPLALLGLVAQALGAFLLFGSGGVSPVLNALTVGFSLLLYQVVLLPFSRRQAKLTNEEDVSIGATGYVVKPFIAQGPHQFVGTVHVSGEQWTAYANEPLEAGDPITVTQKEGLRLFVNRSKNKRRLSIEEITLDENNDIANDPLTVDNTLR